MKVSPNAGPAQIRIHELPEHHVVYLRHVGPYGQPSVVRDLVERLQRWASARDLMSPDSALLLVPHDSPAVTAQDKLRLSVCLTVPPGTRGEGPVGAMQVPGGKFAVARFEIEPGQIAQAWNSVMGEWLPESGYQPDERLCYEVVRVPPTAHPRGLIVLEICVPIRPL